MSSAIETQLKKSQEASRALSLSPMAHRNRFLRLLASDLVKNQKFILDANLEDLNRLVLGYSWADRLCLSSERIKAIAKDVKIIAAESDPLGVVLEKKTLTNGLRLEKKTVPLGVIAVIYESRPNVTIDSACLAIKSGNAVVLKGGQESQKSNLALAKIIKGCLKKARLPEASVSYFEQGRQAVTEIMAARKYIDVIIPRGGADLINFVRANSKVPVIETGAGVCHTYVDKSADLKKAVLIIHNAKTSRPMVCNALDTVILHQAITKQVIKLLAPLLVKSRVKVFADKASYSFFKSLSYPYLESAWAEHFGWEFLGLSLAVKTVPSLEAALQHISRYGSKHSEAIVARNKKAIRTFLESVDAACVYANASTRFTDGSQFGLGGEIGISTQKLHARGPLGLKELVSYKWVIQGQGQIRE